MDACTLKTFRGGTTFVGLNNLRATSFSPLQFAAVARSLGNHAKELALTNSVVQRETILPATGVRPGAFTHTAGVYNAHIALKAFGATLHVQNAMVAFGRRRLNWTETPADFIAVWHIVGGHERVAQFAFDLVFFSSTFKGAALAVNDGNKDTFQSSFDLPVFSARFKEAALLLRSLEHPPATSDPLGDDDLTIVVDDCDAFQSVDFDKFIVDQCQPDLVQPVIDVSTASKSYGSPDMAFELDFQACGDALDCITSHSSQEVAEHTKYSPKDHREEQEPEALQHRISSEETLGHHFDLPDDIAEDLQLHEEYSQDELASPADEIEDSEDESYLSRDIPFTPFDQRIKSVEERYWTVDTSTAEVTPTEPSRNARRRRIRKHKKAQRSTSSNNVALILQQPSKSSDSLSPNDSQDDTQKPRRHRNRKRKVKA